MEFLPIKFFSKREEDKQLVEGGGSSNLPRWILEGEALKIKAKELTADLDDVYSSVNWENRITPVILQAKINMDSKAKTHRRKIEAVFNTKQNNIIGISESDLLLIKIDSASDFGNIQSNILDNEKNAYGISGIDSIERFIPRVDISSETTNYKVKLLNFRDFGVNSNACRQFERFLRSKDIEFVHREYAKSLIIYKLCGVPSSKLDELLSSELFDLAEEICPMPMFQIGLDSLASTKEVNVKYPDTTRKSTIVGVLDNGIEPIDVLKPWINGKRQSPYPNDLIEATHGTFVAGIITYGDQLAEAELTGAENICVFDAAIFPNLKKERIEEDELIENIREVIKNNYEKIKIWNLSISITREVSDNKFSDFAIALDEIQDEFNVLICKSAGNCTNFSKGLPIGKIHEGADSVRSLVVGSISAEKEGFDISEPDNPSPFSRRGPGPAFIIKPDVVHYGGNAGLDSNGKIVESGVFSFSNNNTIIERAGTSFSTPRVAALAAGLTNELDEDFDPLLLKALIVHSSSYSNKLLVPEVERTKYLGYGVPGTVKNILYNSLDEATLILRDSLPKGSYYDIKDFPMPECLIKDGFYIGQILVTLVYDPILDSTQGYEYCQSNMDIRFGSYDEKTIKDTTRKGILNPVGRAGSKNILAGSLYSRTKMKDRNDDFALKERMLIQYGDKYYPVKKYAVDLSELTDGNKVKYTTNNKKWYLYLDGTYRANTEDRAILESRDLSQEFCLIITIRDPLKRGMLYNGITQKLDEYNFWHTNIKISNNISIDISE